MTDAHRHVPVLGDPNHCANCRGPWNAIQHQPSLALVAERAGKATRKLSRLPEALQSLAQYERPSGAPFVPSVGAPATHTGRPAQHSGRTGLVRNGITTEVHPCNKTDAHLRHLHQPGPMTEWFTCNGVRNGIWTSPGPGEPSRPATPEETERYLAANPHMRKVAEVQDSTVYEIDACDHPNGFGPMGCPCGASAPDEDDPATVRDVNTGEDIETTKIIRCPVLECQRRYRNTEIRRHLHEQHQWTGDQWQDWMESTNVVLDLPQIPEEVLKFLDPDITMEQLMTDAATAPEVLGPKEPLTPRHLEVILTEWWMDLAEEEVRRVVPKAVEYGALDLVQIGQDLALTAGRTVTDQEAAELGIYFYVRGKLARWTDAIATGRQVSDDTLHDLGVYIRMAQRVRHSGGWPGLPTD